MSYYEVLPQSVWFYQVADFVHLEGLAQSVCLIGRPCATRFPRSVPQMPAERVSDYPERVYGLDISKSVAKIILELPFFEDCDPWELALIIYRLPLIKRYHNEEEANSIIAKLRCIKVVVNYWVGQILFWMPTICKNDVFILATAIGTMMLFEEKNYEDYSLKKIFGTESEEGNPPAWIQIFFYS